MTDTVEVYLSSNYHNNCPEVTPICPDGSVSIAQVILFVHFLSFGKLSEVSNALHVFAALTEKLMAKEKHFFEQSLRHV